MKKGRLSKTEKEFIDTHVNLGVDAIAEKLDRSTAVIASYLDMFHKKPAKEVQPATQTQATSTDMNLFARNEKRGVVAMTESASMSGDEKKSSKDVYATRKYKNAIHKIKED